MAERLTERCNNGSYTDKGNELWDILTKLGQFEDILEKYGIEGVEELDKKIAYYIDKIDLEAENEYLKKAIEKQNRVSKSISKDRDTWKMACELACEDLQFYDYGNEKTEDGIIMKVDYFYQQAKTEVK